MALFTISGAKIAEELGVPAVVVVIMAAMTVATHVGMLTVQRGPAPFRMCPT